MKKIFTLTVLLLLIDVSLFAQSVLRGKISDKNGEVLIGAVIFPKGTTQGIYSDLNGEYSLNLSNSGTVIINVRFVGYKTIEDTIKCIKGIIIRNYVMDPIVNELEGVVVSAKAMRNNDAALETMKIRSASTIDFISAETIKKTGDANVASAVSRITGVSTTSNGLITVRGVGDRYVKTTLNGMRIPTLDPFTNNLKLDFIPSSLIDNIIISKTERPDLPGDWAGAYISIETKDYPDTLSINSETSIGYNNQSTFKNILSSDRSNTDWLGMDNNLRNYDHSSFIQFNANPSLYQEFVALGLGSYFSSLGVSSSTPWNDTYYKLGLIQLGLMGASQFNDATAFSSAKEQFNSLAYQGRAFDIINSDAVESNKKFSNNWNTNSRVVPINFSQSFTIGNQTLLFGRVLGFIIGLRYSTSNQCDPKSVRNSYEFMDGIPDSATSKFTKYQIVSKETNGWSGLIKLAYKIDNNNSISFLFMPNVIGVNNLRDGKYVEPASNDPLNNPPLLTYSQYQFYESRKQFIYQLKTEHYIPKSKIKINVNASYTNGKSNAPDSRINTLHFTEGFLPDNYEIYYSFPTDFNRYFRNLTDNVMEAQVSFEFPVSKKTEFQRKIKIGGGYIFNHVKNESYAYQFINGSGFQNPSVYTLSSLNQDSIFDIITVDGGGTSYRTVYGYYYKYNSPADNFFGKSHIFSGYAMADYEFSKKIRLSGGVRFESANIYTDCVLFDALGLPADDFRRLVTDVYNLTVDIQPGKLNDINLMPSGSLIFKLNKNEDKPKNLRINFSQSVARPSIRELSETTFYDFESNSYVKGNSQLKSVHINNYDMRFESYFKSGDNYSISAFYKGFKNHIELSNWGFCLSWINNTNYTSLVGVEFEGEKKIIKSLVFKANLTLVYSQTKLNGGTLIDLAGHIFNLKGGNRPMFGQAPYVVNAMLTYSNKKIGLETTLSYNLQGSKLVIITDPTKPDIYELPRHLLDFKISKKLGKHFNLSFKVLDLLNSSTTRSYVNMNNKKYFKNLWNDISGANKTQSELIYSKYRYGTNYILSFSYKL